MSDDPSYILSYYMGITVGQAAALIWQREVDFRKQFKKGKKDEHEHKEVH